MENYKEILLKELLPALGCTEPIALALCAAKAKEVLGEEVKSAKIFCSANIIKNVKAVIIPNSGGLKGIEVACALGFIGGNAKKILNVLEDVNDEHRKKAQEFIAKGKISVELEKGEENLYIRCELWGDEHFALVELQQSHTGITRIVKDEKVVFDVKIHKDEQLLDLSTLNVKDIYTYANSIDLNSSENEELVHTIQTQIKYNYAIGKEGLKHDWGAHVGQTLATSLKGGACGEINSIALAAAGSDARMSGCSLPVVINSGSGNQGMTVAIPLIAHAKEHKIDDEKLYRALIFANLLAIHQKRFIGKLSAFCGVVSASAASGAGLGYLQDYPYEKICNIITNTLATTGGMVCDGAKPSCAAKIAVSLNNAIIALNMSNSGFVFESGEGIVGENIEETIQNVGYMARVGMKETDEEILNIMLHKQHEG